MEPPNKGHFVSGGFSPYSEAVLCMVGGLNRMYINTMVISMGATAGVLYIEVVLWWEAPLY